MSATGGGASPKVTIALAARNCEATVALTLRSLIGQTLTDWELLLMEDGSTDGTLDAIGRVSDSRVRLFSDGQSRGLASRLNQAIDLACTPYIARMDADDICYPTRLQKQFEYLEAHVNVDVLACRAFVFRDDGVPVGVLPSRVAHEEITSRPWSGFFLPHPTWMGRTRWFRAHRYDAAFKRAQDYELLFRTYRSSRFASLPDILLGYRQESISLRKSLSGRFFTAKAHMRHGKSHAGWGRSARAVSMQGVKGILDTVATIAGGAKPLQRGRLDVAAPHEVEIWREVWQMIAKAG